MASLSIARPGKVSERQYLGDLAGLFDRQRRRAGVALTPDSFASDLAANDALRSGLFTLCNAISHMGEHDLTAEEMLGLVARALGNASSAEGETGADIPPDMREAFLSGYEAWQNRDVAPIDPLGEPQVWPPAPSGVRKPPVRETSIDSGVQEFAAAASGTAGPAEPQMSIPGRRTVQEALGMVRRGRAGDVDESPADSAPAAGGGDVGSITLGQLKHMLEEIEGRVSRLGPQLSSTAREPSRRERPAPLPDTVIPFPARRNQTGELHDDDPHGLGSDFDSFVRLRPIPAPNTRAEDAFLAQASETDERPRGIDALVAAAPAWANATPTSRGFNEEAFLARHAYLAPARRPGSSAPASIYYAETPAAPLAPPPATLPQAPVIVTAALAAPAGVTALLPPPLIGLDAEDDPLLSPMERLEARLLRLSPRRVFLTLASLTVLAGGLAGFIAYRTLHSNRARQFKDLEQTAHFGAPASLPQPVAASVPATAANPAPQPAPAQPANAAIAPAAATTPKASAPRTPTTPAPRWKPRSPSEHVPAVAVWPPVPQQIVRDAASAAPAPANVSPASSVAASQFTSPGPLYVSAPTMIGYALTTPQPAYPAAQAHGISGTVAVEVTVSRLGDVTSARAISGPPELRAAAVAAVRGWHFRPYLVEGKPAEVATTLQFFFKGE